jgi:uncharacterized coiled-coil protein SlyX
MNIAIGISALAFNVAMNESTAVGYQAMLYANSTTAVASTYNTAVGAYALQGSGTPANNTGTKDTAVGHSALLGITTGVDNTALGYMAGNSGTAVTTGSQNTLIGSTAQMNGQYSNATALGYGAIVTASNRVQIGNASVTTIYLGATGGTAYTYSFGGIITNSDRRLKKDIEVSDLGLDFIEKLKPVSYRFIKGNGDLRYGFIAQDVEKILGRPAGMVTHQDDKMKSYGLNYLDIIAPVVKAVQELDMKFHALEQTVKDLISRLNPLEKTVAEQQTTIAKQQAQIEALAKSVEEMKTEVKDLRKKK